MSNARKVRIVFKNTISNAVVKVIDDGIGMNMLRKQSSEVPLNSFGLFSIQERMSTLGGKMDITSIPGKGTEVSLTIPHKQTGTTKQ